MKTKMFLFVVAFAATATLISCSKSKENGKLSPEQKVLLGKMDVAYKGAKIYNDSLMNCNPSNSSYTTLINLYDSCYHSNDSLFDHCHADMMNTDGGMMGDNGGGMMGGNGGMMGGNGGMMTNNGMCNTQNNELNQVMINMNQLREVHKNYHPKK